MPTRLLLFEDNDFLRECIAAMVALHDRFELAGAFNNAIEINEAVKLHRPDCILMDIDLPGISGIEALGKLRTNNEWVPVIMLTVFDDSDHVLKAIKQGASGYILKKNLSDKLFQSIDEVLSGGAPMSPAVARMVVESIQPKNVNPYQLSEREREILRSLALGNSYKIIASKLNISIDTVRTHIKKIYDKLQVHSQTEAVSKAWHEKLI